MCVTAKHEAAVIHVVIGPESLIEYGQSRDSPGRGPVKQQVEVPESQRRWRPGPTSQKARIEGSREEEDENGVFDMSQATYKVRRGETHLSKLHEIKAPLRRL